jgi:hypothetical protein
MNNIIIFLLTEQELSSFQVLVAREKINSEDITKIWWHVDPLLGSDREIDGCRAVVARQPLANNRRVVFLRGQCREVTSGTS